MPIDVAIIRFFPAAVAAYLCCYGPGHAWWGGASSGIPRPFARVAASLLLTSITALALVQLRMFSLPRVVAVAGLVTLVGYLSVGRRRFVAHRQASTGVIGGILVFLLAFSWYWPPFEAHLAASDASSYLAAGVRLARAHQLAAEDDLGPVVPPSERDKVFLSVLGLPFKPPYSRLHGGLVVDTPGAAWMYPSFFPLPTAWAGIFADALGARYAGGYVALFAAAAVWAAWLLARDRLGLAGAITVTLLTAANAGAYWAARMPLSEPIAWFFVAAALVALDSYDRRGAFADARLAGALLGAAAMTRIEYTGFVFVALCLRVLLRPAIPGRPLTTGFVFCLLSLLAVAALETWLVQGAYTTPLADTARGFQWILAVAWKAGPWRVVLPCAAAVVAYAILVRCLGFVRATAGAIVLGFIVAYARATGGSSFLRSLRWQVDYFGWPAVLLALAGGVHAWRGRGERASDAFLVIVSGVIAACLFYDPHVLPMMPWASRRFVPVVVPCGLLFAGMACSAIGRRFALAGLLAWALFVGGVLAPASKIWHGGHYDGTYDQLNAFVSQLPLSGALLIDNRLATTLLAPPLFLVYGRNSLPVDAASDDGRAVIAKLVVALNAAGKGPVHLIRPAVTFQREPIPRTRSTRATDFSMELRLPQQTDGPPPRYVEKFVVHFAVDRLDPVTSLSAH